VTPNDIDFADYPNYDKDLKTGVNKEYMLIINFLKKIKMVIILS